VGGFGTALHQTITASNTGAEGPDRDGCDGGPSLTEAARLDSTVESHVCHLLTKTGLGNRTQTATWGAKGVLPRESVGLRGGWLDVRRTIAGPLARSPVYLARAPAHG
jgi:hypothetical protein